MMQSSAVIVHDLFISTPREDKLKGTAPVFATHARRFIAAINSGNSFDTVAASREGDVQFEGPAGRTAVFADGSVANFKATTCSWQEGLSREPRIW